MAEDGPAGYYVGRPINYDDQKSQPPPPTSQAAAEQVNAQVPGACITDPSLLPGFPVPFLFLSTCLNLVPFGKGRLLRRPCGRQESRRRRPELRCCRSDEQTIGLPCQLFRMLLRRSHCKINSVEKDGSGVKMMDGTSLFGRIEIFFSRFFFQQWHCQFVQSYADADQ
ncbi:uncharacterized protein LOC112902634 isoform X2 [Panicum hallii]|uniref:uncharacterized protein LOC112902634 isoform X2 n=1 Tax=Panicum hallii TaxID=206008 RepID=UPI000DF4D35E|nr:uncharacterized protein LOC112902634 isoform X2 [Panicum hallii]